MIAGIDFVIYDDFSKYVTYPYYDENGKYHKNGGDDPDYTRALKILNKDIQNYIDKNELIFTYKGKRVKIITPIQEYSAGNIFGREDYDGPCWEGITIYCEIPINEKDFKADKLIVHESPGYFIPKAVVY